MLIDCPQMHELRLIDKWISHDNDNARQFIPDEATSQLPRSQIRHNPAQELTHVLKHGAIDLVTNTLILLGLQ